MYVLLRPHIYHHILGPSYMQHATASAGLLNYFGADPNYWMSEGYMQTEVGIYNMKTK